MTHDASPARGVRLGRAAGADGLGSTVSGAVLVFPSRSGPVLLSPGPVRRVIRELARAGGPDGLAVHLVQEADGDPGAAAEEAVRRYGDVPVCLAGYGTGGLAALRGAGHAAVNSVVALAPCLPDGEAPSGSPEPVNQLAGRQVLIVHGTNDGRAHPESSFRLAARAKKTNRSTCRFEVHSDGHRLREHRAEVAALTVDFVLGAVLGGRWSRPVTDALAAPPPLGLRMPLAAGFGRSLRG
ncbi:prolyl oligopeptidase family serine peptidase [Streptomyces sp. NPDC012888]|uniref:prolyl oligopeptidase family serine peptidase n=1 Tax=Streptomyces sp. NPDC012888 TaxID=3364855 RepID=UPI0036AF4FEF